MKKKSNYRTPKRLLSLFLCVLMVVGFMPYCAVQNKAKAATTSIVHTAPVSRVNIIEEDSWGDTEVGDSYENVEYPAENVYVRNVRPYVVPDLGNILTVCILHDFNPIATNYTTKGGNQIFNWNDIELYLTSPVLTVSGFTKHLSLIHI